MADVLMCVYYADLLGSIDFKRRCTEWSVYDIKVPLIREPTYPMISNGSHGTLMSYTDHSVQCRLKSIEPNKSA